MKTVQKKSHRNGEEKTNEEMMSEREPAVNSEG